MIDAIRDLLQNGQPIVVEAENWRGIEAQLRAAGIQFWGWQRFTSDDGADCIGVNVPANDHAEAREIAGMTDGDGSFWGMLGKALIAIVLIALVALAIAGGAL